MEYRKFTKNLEHAGLSIREFASLLNMHGNSITNYAQKGQVPGHLGIISQLIVVMHDQAMDFRKVLQESRPRQKGARGIPFHQAKMPARYYLDISRRSPAPKPQRPGDKPLTAPGERPVPRFRYPGDLMIPEESVPVTHATPEPANKKHDVPVTYRRRSKPTPRA